MFVEKTCVSLTLCISSPAATTYWKCPARDISSTAETCSISSKHSTSSVRFCAHGGLDWNSCAGDLHHEVVPDAAEDGGTCLFSLLPLSHQHIHTYLSVNLRNDNPQFGSHKMADNPNQTKGINIAPDRKNNNVSQESKKETKSHIPHKLYPE